MRSCADYCGVVAQSVTARRAGLVFLVTLALMALALAIFENAGSPDYDGRRYLAMTRHPGAHVEAPYVTRVFAPFIAWVLPGDAMALRLLTVISFAATAALLYLLLAPRTSHRRALAGVAVFLAGATTPNIRDPFLIDAASFAIMAAVLLAAVERRWWWLLALLPIAVLTRDALVVILAPALLLLAARDRRSWPPMALAFGLTASVWVALAQTSLVLGFKPELLNNFSSGNIDWVLEYARGYGPLAKVAATAALFVFGTLWLAPAFAWRAIREHPWAVGLALSAVVVIALAPLVTQWSRALTYAFPLIAASVALLPRSGAPLIATTLAGCLFALDYLVQPMAVSARFAMESVLLLAMAGALVAASKTARPAPRP